MKKYLLSLFVVSTFTAFTFAQDAEESSESEVEEVVVKGIKSSLKDAIDIKRSNVGVMEAITAEDFGKFPDGNLAESLARIAGVGIDRSKMKLYDVENSAQNIVDSNQKDTPETTYEKFSDFKL